MLLVRMKLLRWFSTDSNPWKIFVVFPKCSFRTLKTFDQLPQNAVSDLVKNWPTFQLLKGGIHGSPNVLICINQNTYFRTSYKFYPVKSPTQMFFSDHILYLLAQAERRMAKIHRKYQWITPTLSTLNLVLTRRFYSMVDESTAICRLMSVACANSCEIIKR